MIARQLRRLYQHPAQALAIVRADAASHDAAARALPMLQEIGTTRNQPLILEALFIAENMITGPQHFDHAFRPRSDFG